MKAHAATAYLSIGSNLGDRKRNLRSAVKKLKQHPGIEVISGSSLYETAAVGTGTQPDFINTVIMVRTELNPNELLELLKEIERDLGRVPESHNQPRAIDIDIVLYDDLVSADHGLTIPHPRLEERAFVLEPLLEVSPDLMNPATGKSLEDSLEALRGSQRIARVENSRWWEWARSNRNMKDPNESQLHRG